jgi:hypothetical protein
MSSWLDGVLTMPRQSVHSLVQFQKPFVDHDWERLSVMVSREQAAEHVRSEDATINVALDRGFEFQFSCVLTWVF